MQGHVGLDDRIVFQPDLERVAAVLHLLRPWLFGDGTRRFARVTRQFYLEQGRGVGGLEFWQRLRGDELAVVNEYDVVAYLVDVRQYVGREQDGAARLKLLDDVEHLFAADGVKRRHRLVEDDDLGVVHERLGDAKPLLHAARIGGDAPVFGVCQPDELQQLTYGLFLGGVAEVEDICHEAQVFLPGHPAVHRRQFRQVADVVVRRALAEGNWRTRNSDAARRRL